MQSKATTVEKYLAELPVERREAMQAVRGTILKHLPDGYEEGMQYGMIGYYVPHSVFPAGYHCDPKQPLPFAGLASLKNYMSLYLMCIYGHPENESWFRKAWTSAGKKLDMGKSCIRFKSIDEVPLNVVGEAIARVPVDRYLRHYEAALAEMASRKPGPAAAKKKVPAKQTSTRPTSAAKKKGVKAGKEMPAAKSTSRSSAAQKSAKPKSQNSASKQPKPKAKAAAKKKKA